MIVEAQKQLDIFSLLKNDASSTVIGRKLNIMHEKILLLCNLLCRRDNNLIAKTSFDRFPWLKLHSFSCSKLKVKIKAYRKQILVFDQKDSYWLAQTLQGLAALQIRDANIPAAIQTLQQAIKLPE